jgi:hypothetical protein
MAFDRNDSIKARFYEIGSDLVQPLQLAERIR